MELEFDRVDNCEVEECAITQTPPSRCVNLYACQSSTISSLLGLNSKHFVDRYEKFDPEWGDGFKDNRQYYDCLFVDQYSGQCYITESVDCEGDEDMFMQPNAIWYPDKKSCNDCPSTPTPQECFSIQNCRTGAIDFASSISYGADGNPPVMVLFAPDEAVYKGRIFFAKDRKDKPDFCALVWPDEHPGRFSSDMHQGPVPKWGKEFVEWKNCLTVRYYGECPGPAVNIHLGNSAEFVELDNGTASIPQDLQPNLQGDKSTSGPDSCCQLGGCSSLVCLVVKNCETGSIEEGPNWGPNKLIDMSFIDPYEWTNNQKVKCTYFEQAEGCSAPQSDHFGHAYASMNNFIIPTEEGCHPQCKDCVIIDNCVEHLSPDYDSNTPSIWPKLYKKGSRLINPDDVEILFDGIWTYLPTGICYAVKSVYCSDYPEAANASSISPLSESSNFAKRDSSTSCNAEMLSTPGWCEFPPTDTLTHSPTAFKECVKFIKCGEDSPFDSGWMDLEKRVVGLHNYERGHYTEEQYISVIGETFMSGGYWIVDNIAVNGYTHVTMGFCFTVLAHEGCYDSIPNPMSDENDDYAYEDPNSRTRSLFGGAKSATKNPNGTYSFDDGISEISCGNRLCRCTRVTNCVSGEEYGLYGFVELGSWPVQGNGALHLGYDMVGIDECYLMKHMDNRIPPDYPGPYIENPNDPYRRFDEGWIDPSFCDSACPEYCDGTQEAIFEPRMSVTAKGMSWLYPNMGIARSQLEGKSCSNCENPATPTPPTSTSTLSCACFSHCDIETNACFTNCLAPGCLIDYNEIGKVYQNTGTRRCFQVISATGCKDSSNILEIPFDAVEVTDCEYSDCWKPTPTITPTDTHTGVCACLNYCDTDEFCDTNCDEDGCFIQPSEIGKFYKDYYSDRCFKVVAAGECYGNKDLEIPPGYFCHNCFVDGSLNPSNNIDCSESDCSKPTPTPSTSTPFTETQTLTITPTKNASKFKNVLLLTLEIHLSTLIFYILLHYLKAEI